MFDESDNFAPHEGGEIMHFPPYPNCPKKGDRFRLTEAIKNSGMLHFPTNRQLQGKDFYPPNLDQDVQVGSECTAHRDWIRPCTGAVMFDDFPGIIFVVHTSYLEKLT